MKFALTPFCTVALLPVRDPPGTKTMSSTARLLPAAAGRPSASLTEPLPRPSAAQPEAPPTANVSLVTRALPAGRARKLGVSPGSAGHVPPSSL